MQERLRRAAKLPPEAHYPRGGWAGVVDRMAALAWNLGVRMETLSRVDTLPTDAPVIVATSLDAARRLLDDPALTWPSGRTTLVDLAVRTRRGDAFAVSDLDAPGWIERFTAQDRTLAPAGEQLIQGRSPSRRTSRRRTAPHAPSTCSTWASRLARAADLAARGGRERPYRRRRPARNHLARPAGRRPRRRRLPRR